ncbi:MAG: NUDIX domain-containing protein [Candidatus Omnitrophica bacterium]|nr:NUDIX domain-containing protein [Candidatus Omnitrophota bacterium]
MAQEAFRHLREEKTALKEVVFCLYDKESYDVFRKGAIGYLEHLTDVIQWGPFVTVDAIIETAEGVVIIKRSNPPFGWALPGGFVDYGETLEDAVTREAKEETGLTLEDLKQFHTYSKPGRDPRFHTITTVFTAKAKGKPKAGDDAGQAKVIPLSDIGKMEFAFDHRQVLEDYVRKNYEL